jgi:hypothetical protein
LARHKLRVRLLSLAVGCVLLVATLELVSFALFYVGTGRRFSYAGVAADRAMVESEALPGPAVAPPPPGPEVEGRPETTPADLVPHPFSGFVYNPESRRLRQQQGRGAMELTDLGFFRLPEPPGQREELQVAIFGGSMAAYLCIDGREGLERTLAQGLALGSRRVQVQCFALGGFKQPQMATTLVYLSALGRRFDAVIELDGFNEVALSFDDYKKRRLFPAFPRDWDHLVVQSPDVEEQMRAGRVAYLLQWRARLARWFSRRPLSWSVTAALVWKSVHRLVGRDLARAREELTLPSGPEDDYRRRGPFRSYANDGDLLQDIAHVWGRSSLQMHHLCAGAGTRYGHFLQPNQYLPGSKPMGPSERAVAYRAEQIYRLPVELGYPLLQAEGAHLAQEGVDFHDLTGIFSARSEPLYVDECCHVNATGSAILGEAIGRALVAGWSRWPPRPVPPR